MTDEERLREIHHVTSTVRNAPSALARIRTILDEGACSASRFVSPAPGVMIGAITPEASALIDEILAAWDAHAPNVRPNNDLIGVTTPDRETLYGFVYWLCRWSGLVRPVRTILDDVPSVEWHTRPADGEDYAEPEPDVDLVVSDEAVPGEETGAPFGIAIRFGMDGPRYYETGFTTRAAAQARAVAIYMALRGVT